MHENTFHKIRRLVEKIPEGKVTTYGELAKAVGIKDTRQVVWALQVINPVSFPWYRVVKKIRFLSWKF